MQTADELRARIKPIIAHLTQTGEMHDRDPFPQTVEDTWVEDAQEYQQRLGRTLTDAELLDFLSDPDD